MNSVKDLNNLNTFDNKIIKIHKVKKCKHIGPIIRDVKNNKIISLVLYGYKKKGKKCYGVIKLFNDDNIIVKKLKESKGYGEKFIFNLKGNDEKYDYICGIFHSKVSYNDNDLFNFRKSYYGTINRFYNNSYNFVFGSCRFFPNIMGYGFLVNKTDKPFKSIVKMIDNYRINSLFLIGDSVYMDIVKWLPLRLKNEKQINRIHITARKTKYFKKLGSMIEIKEIPDDHEYRDNGSPINYHNDIKAYQNCINAINLYEISSGPHEKGNMNIKYWSYFKRNDIPFFMMDSRYERWIDNDGNKRIISLDQMNYLKDKMIKNKNNNLPFIILCPVPFILQNGNDDVFSSSKKDQKEIIDFIVKNKIKNVFFLTGDAHAGISSKFKIYKDGEYTGVDVVEILSSGIYQYAHDSPKTFKNNLQIDEYYIHSNSNLQTLRDNVISFNNFCLIEVDKENKLLRASYFKSNGKYIKNYEYEF